jgi:hypothetical protein
MGSVPGLAAAPSALVGSGPCSASYSIDDQSDHVPPVCIRTSTPMASLPISSPFAQVTPTVP